jgi:hypothetical protein
MSKQYLIIRTHNHRFHLMDTRLGSPTPEYPVTSAKGMISLNKPAARGPASANFSLLLG